MTFLKWVINLHTLNFHVLCSSGGPDKKFDGVLKRVRAQQEAQDKANAALQASKAATVSMLIPDAKVDWSKFRSEPACYCCCACCLHYC
jgi:hypothetical protein